MQGLICWYLTMSLTLCFSWLCQAQHARHHGRRGPRDSYLEVHRCSSWTRSLTCPLVCYEWRHGPDSAENCLAIPQVQLIITVVVSPFRCAVAVPHGPLRQQIIEIPLLFVFGGRCPCCAGRACHTCCCQRQVREAQTLQKTIGFPQLLFKFVDVPFVPQTQILMVQTFQQTTEFPQLQYFRGGRCPC